MTKVIFARSLSPDGRRILAVTPSGTRIWDLPQFPSLPVPLTGATLVSNIQFTGQEGQARVEQCRDAAQSRFDYWERIVGAKEAALAGYLPLSSAAIPHQAEWDWLFGKAFLALRQSAKDPSQLVKFHHVRAEFYARRSWWTNAADDALAVIEVGTTDHMDFHTTLPLLAACDRTDDYIRVCRQALRQFKATTDPPTADRIAKDC